MRRCLARVSTRTASMPLERRTSRPAVIHCSLSSREVLALRSGTGTSKRRAYHTIRYGIVQQEFASPEKLLYTTVWSCPGSPLKDLARVTQTRRVVSKPLKPMHFRLLPEPCNLPLGVPSRGLLDLLNRGLELHSAFQMLPKMRIPEKGEWLRRCRNAHLHQPLHLRDPPGVQHLLNAQIDSRVKRVAGRRKPDFRHGVTCQAHAPLAEQLRHPLAREHADLDGSYGLLRVPR